MIQQVDSLSESLFGIKVFPNFQPPAKYAGEAFGNTSSLVEA